MKNSEEPISPTYKFVECNGLTKREHFAGLAMQGLMTTLIPTEDNQLCPNKENVVNMAKLAITAADALLAELEKPKP